MQVRPGLVLDGPAGGKQDEHTAHGLWGTMVLTWRPHPWGPVLVSSKDGPVSSWLVRSPASCWPRLAAVSRLGPFPVRMARWVSGDTGPGHGALHVERGPGACLVGGMLTGGGRTSRSGWLGMLSVRSTVELARREEAGGTGPGGQTWVDGHAEGGSAGSGRRGSVIPETAALGLSSHPHQGSWVPGSGAPTPCTGLGAMRSWQKAPCPWVPVQHA